jgi:putative transcriptional regulator
MIKPDKGILLIAEPFLKDPHFMRTVVIICEHKHEGSIGFVLNKKFDQTLNQLIPDLEGLHLPVYFGGPVQLDTLHFLHTYPNLIPGSVQITEGIFWGGDFEQMISLLKREEIDPRKIRFFIGYSGWSEGQLDHEMNEKSWLTVEASKEIVFAQNPDDIWKEALKKLGGTYEQMIHYPIDPQLN